MGWLFVLAALAAVASSGRAQTIEGQPIAAQFGEYRVADNGNGFSFAPYQCNVLGAGQNFPAFTTGVPVKVWDPQAGFTEVSTQVTAFVSGSNCAVSLGGLTHPHLASFYLTSGTGGLQEAINNSKVPPGVTNTIILNSRWYELIQPRTAAQVIGAITGSTQFGLIDITTNPYTSYTWNGSQYVAIAVSGTGATFPSAGGLVYSTSATASRPATSADVAGLIASAAIAPASVSAGSVADSGLTPGNCVQAGTGGALATASGPCGSGSGATFPSSSGLVVNTSTTVARTATSADVTSLVAGAPITPAIVDNVVQAAGVNGAGIGVAPTAWSSSTGYAQCAAVSNGGNNYLAVAANNNVTPGTNSSIWWQVPNAGTPTNGDCAFYIAASQVNGAAGAELVLPPGNTNTCIGLMEPTVTSPGNPNVVIHGAGKHASTLTQTCNIVSSGNAVLQQPNSGVGYALAGVDWEDFSVNANFLASAAINVYGAQQFKIKHILLENPADGSDHYIEFGHAAGANHAMAWTYQMDLEDIDTVDAHGPGQGANISASVSAGVPTFTVVSGGSAFTSSYSQLILSGTGSNADTPCTNRGTDTINVSGGAITSISTTATGCSSPLYASVFGGNRVTYCFKFNDASDSNMIMALTPSECNTGVFSSNITSLMSFTKIHAIATMIGISDAGNNSYWASQLDTIYRYGFDFEGATNVDNIYGSKFEWATNLLPGASDYHFGTISNSPANAPYAINIFGDACGDAATFNGYNHFLPSSGSVEASGGALPAFVHAYNSESCDQTASTANAANYTGQNFSLGNGAAGAVFNFGLGNGLVGAINLTYPSNNGIYNWNYQNATAATSSNNYSSPQLRLGGNYWNGTASTPAYVQLQTLFGSGGNPAETVQFSLGGTPSSGARNYAFDSPVTELNQGTFGASNYTSYLNSIVSGSTGSIGNCALNGGAWYQPVTAAIFGCVTAPAAGSGNRNTVGGLFTAYSQDPFTTSYNEPVGIVGEGIASANGVQAYGANLIAGDSIGCCGSNVILVGQENDLQMFYPPSGYASGTALRANLGFTNGNLGTYAFDAIQVGSNVPGAYWRDALYTSVGALGASSVVLNLNAQGNATSTSGNYNCPRLANIYETYWTGSASASEQWDLLCTIGTGTTPSDYFKIQNSGGAAGANHYFDLTGGIQLELDGATSGSAYLSASATGGTLNLGSSHATVDSSGNLSVLSCTGCGTSSSGIVTAKVINGVSYTVNYAGSTFDQRVNAAMSDAINGTNGNTSCIVDSSGEPEYLAQTSQINVGAASMSACRSLTWILPPNMYDEVTLTSGSAYAVYQYPSTSILCKASVQEGGCRFSNYSAANNIYAMYGQAPVSAGQPGYYTLNGAFFSNDSGSTFASGGMALAPYGYDGTNFENDQFFDDAPSQPSNTFVLKVGPAAILCCHSKWENNTVDSEWGATALDIEVTGGGAAQVVSVNFDNNTFNTHGTTATGNPNILCHDTTGTSSIISFSGATYMEGQTVAMSAPWVKDNGCKALSFDGQVVLQPSATASPGSTAPFMEITTLLPASQVHLNQLLFSAGPSNAPSSSWTLPAYGIKQDNVTADCASAPCLLAASDSNGFVAGYDTGTKQMQGLLTATGRFSGAGAASAPGLSVTGAPYTGGTGTTTTPQLYMNSGATAPISFNTSGTILGMNAPSGFSGSLLDFRVNGGGTLFNVAANGGATFASSLTVDNNLTLTNGSAVGITDINSTAATSTTCSNPQGISFQGRYYTGSASATNSISLTPGCTAGANGAETLTVANSGTTGPFTLVDSGSFAESAAGTASSPGVSITGAPYTGGTATTNFPQLYLNQGTAVTTLSTAGTEFGINAPNGFAGHLINLFVNGGSTRFRVDYLGNTFIAGTETVSSNLGLSSTSAPTIANGAGAGTSPGTPTIAGNNNAGVVTVITGTSTTASSTLATITFNGTLGTVPQGCSLFPRNSAATGANLFYTTAPSSTSFTVGVGGTAAAASTTYSWNYLCF